jgi:hypothetical protein
LAVVVVEADNKHLASLEQMVVQVVELLGQAQTADLVQPDKAMLEVTITPLAMAHLAVAQERLVIPAHHLHTAQTAALERYG